MVRRIVSCKSCRKRFTTCSGSTLCLSCRPKENKEPLPQLKYGGSSLSLLATSSPSRSSQVRRNNHNDGRGINVDLSTARVGEDASANKGSNDGNINNLNQLKQSKYHTAMEDTGSFGNDNILQTVACSSIDDSIQSCPEARGNIEAVEEITIHRSKRQKKISNNRDIQQSDMIDSHIEDDTTDENLKRTHVMCAGDAQSSNGWAMGDDVGRDQQQPLACMQGEKTYSSTATTKGFAVPRCSSVTSKNSGRCSGDDTDNNGAIINAMTAQQESTQSQTQRKDCVAEKVSIDCDSGGIICLNHSSDEEQKRVTSGVPRVSLGSTTNNGGYSSEDSEEGSEDDEMDEIIGQESMWSSTKKKISKGTNNEVNNPSNGCENDDESNDEMDQIIIEQESTWSSRKESGEAERINDGMHNGTSHNIETRERGDDDDSDIECLGTSSQSQTTIERGNAHKLRESEEAVQSNDIQMCNNGRAIYDCENDDDDSDIECMGSSSQSQTANIDPAPPMKGNDNYHDDSAAVPETDLLKRSQAGSDNGWQGLSRDSGASRSINCESSKSETLCLETNNNCQPPPPSNSPKKDVCYICGSDLSRLSTGLRGRVAHMKRCSAKYGNTLGGRRGMMNHDGDYDAEFVESGAEEDRSSPKKDSLAASNNNPYNKVQQWHGDASSGLELNKAMSPSNNNSLVSKQAGNPKQSMLNQFFKAPVRSLTNVLMAGAKQAAKGKAIVASKTAAAAASNTGKKPYRRGQWRQNNNRRTGSCPAFKRITGTDFICDGFQYACQSLSENYFLTHFHSDHYGGITKTWSDGTIYLSLPTANLVASQLGVDKKYLHPIPMNTPTVIASRGKPVTVTLLDANHCPGAIMFLFTVGNRNILHVGDFRWNRDLMMQMPQLRALGNSSPRLDELFFDTTYCKEKYTLPTQAEAISEAIEVAEKEMALSKKDQKMKTLFLFGSYTIGKERIYVSVAERLKMKVYVDTRRYRILSSLEWPKERMQIFTTKKTESSLWVVPLGSVNHKQMRDYMDEANKTKAFTAPYGRVVGFRPTGWTYSGAPDKKQRTLDCGQSKPTKKLISSKTSGRFTVHGVPYSEHSSFPELVDCLRCLKPKKIIPTVSVSKSEEQVELLLKAL